MKIVSVVFYDETLECWAAAVSRHGFDGWTVRLCGFEKERFARDAAETVINELAPRIRMDWEMRGAIAVVESAYLGSAGG